MTGGIGFSRAAMDSSRNNRNLLKDSMNRNFIQKGGHKGKGKIIIEKADPKVLDAIRMKVAKVNKRRNIMLGSFIFMSVILLVYFLLAIT
ncbi:MAG: hypothetical protein ACI9L9_001920 [Marivirga sp.]|jgi:hypothetical protein